METTRSPVALHLYLLIRLGRAGAPGLSMDEFSRALLGIFAERQLGDFRLILMADDAGRLRLESSFVYRRAFTFTEHFQRLRAAVIEGQAHLGFWTPIEFISAVATVGRLWWMGEAPPETDIPGWILEEWRDQLILDEPAFALLLPHEREGFEPLRLHVGLPLFAHSVRDDLQRRSERAAAQGLLRRLKNVPDSDEKLDVPPMTVTIPCEGIEELWRLAEQAYNDIPQSPKGVGGRALLMSFCLERNRARSTGDAVIPNASALGLRYERQAGGLIDRLLSGDLILKQAIGGPPATTENRG